MAYTIEVYDSGSSSWQEINWVRWKHERGDTFFSTLMFWCAYNEQDKLSTRAWVRMYDSSNVVWFRGKLLDEGEYRRSGEMKVTCRGRGQELLDYELDLDYTSSTVTNEDIVEDVFVTELGYTDSSNFNRENVGYSLTNYSFSGKLRDFLREMNRNYAYATVIEPDTSKYSDPSNAVPQVWYVPIGYYSSGESLDTSSDAVVIRKWRKGLDWNRKDKIRAFGIDVNGDEIEAISGAISAFEDVFESIYIPYAASSSELQDIADSIKDPGTKEGGIIEVSPKYEVYLANDTIDLVDSPRSINDTFVVKKQVNYSAGNKSELTLGEAYVNPSELSRQFEQEHMQNRHQLITGQDEDVGQQDTTNVTSGTGTAAVSTSGGVDDDYSDTSVSGNVDNDLSNTSVTGAVQNTTLPSVGGTVWAIGPTLSMAAGDPCRAYMDDGNIMGAITSPPTFQTSRGWVYFQNRSGSSQSVTLSMDFPSGSSFSDSVSVSDGATHYYTSGESNSSNKDGWFKFDVTGYSYSDSEKYGYAQNIYAHTHGSHGHGDDFDTDDDFHGHGDDFNTDDNLHGHTDNISSSDSGHSDHPISGKTDSKNISIFPMNLKDR